MLYQDLSTDAGTRPPDDDEVVAADELFCRSGRSIVIDVADEEEVVVGRRRPCRMRPIREAFRRIIELNSILSPTPTTTHTTALG